MVSLSLARTTPAPPRRAQDDRRYVPLHAVRYSYLEEMFRVLRCDGWASFQLGLGNHTALASYGNDDATASTEVSLPRADPFLENLERVGFRDARKWTARAPRAQTSGSGGRAADAARITPRVANASGPQPQAGPHPASAVAKSLFVTARKQCPTLGIKIIIAGEEVENFQGTNEKYVDPIVPDLEADVGGRVYRKGGSVSREEAEAAEAALRDEIGDLEDRLEAARRKLHGDARHRGPKHRRAPT